MWLQVNVNGLEAFTQYPRPFTAETLDPIAMMGGLDQAQLRSRDAHHGAGHAVVGMAFGLPGTAAFLPAASTGGCGESGHVSVGPFSAELRHLLAFHAAGVRAAHRWLAEESLLTPATAFLNDVLAGAVERLSRDLAPVNR